MRKILALFLCLTVILSMPYPTFAEEPDKPTISSSSAIVMEAKTGQILYEKQIHTKHFPASITKIITSILALEKGNLNDTITFSDTAVFSIERGSSHLWMVPEEQITLEQGLLGLLISSANDVANGIAELIDGSIENFASHMNEKAKELGAKNTHFVNPHGLHDENHYTTAYDMALIAREALKYPKYREIIKTIRYEIPPTNKNEIRYLLNQHKMLENPIHEPTYFYDGCEGGKTGYTDQARHTLVTYAKRNNMELIVVVLEADSQDIMYTDTTTLLDYGFNHFELRSLNEKGNGVQSIPIIGKEDAAKIQYGNMLLTFESNQYYVFPKPFDPSKLHREVHLPVELQPPIKKNDIVGTIDYSYNKKIIRTIKVLASSSYEMTAPVYASAIEKKEHQVKKGPSLGRLFGMVGLLILLFSAFFLILITLQFKYKKRDTQLSKKN